jgi:hypothetical protein
MARYLVAIHLPDDYDLSAEGEAMSRDIDALNEEMIAAGVRIFASGLSAARNAKSLQAHLRLSVASSLQQAQGKL